MSAPSPEAPRGFTPWRVQHVELAAAIPSIPAGHGTGGVFVVFWWRGIPLGTESLAAERLPVPSTQLLEIALQSITPAVGAHLLESGFRAPLPLNARQAQPDRVPALRALVELERPLKQLGEQIDPHPQPGKRLSVSVVVCTRDRPEPLERCLGSLQQLTPAPQEIVVVDNASRSSAVRDLVEGTRGVRYVAEPRPGLSVARNTGIRSTVGEVVAFTDDDVVVEPHWIARLQRAFDDPRVLAVTGLVLPAELETEAQYMFQHGHSGFGWGFRPLLYDEAFFARMKPRGVPVWHVGAGANMAFRREAFRHTGLFDERLGAGASGCSEDSEMWYRVLAEGWHCRYEPTAVVHHYHRGDMAALRHQMYQYMRGHMAALLIQWEKYGHGGNLYRAFVILPAYYARLLLHRATRVLLGTRPDGTLRAQMAGCVAGIGFYLRNRRSPEAFRAPHQNARPSAPSAHSHGIP